MQKKRAIVVHGWEGKPQSNWFPWLREELEKRDFKVFVPLMPNSNHPKADAWLNCLSQVVGMPDEETFFIGHSLGCITILRYIESLKKNIKIGGVILVAGFTTDLGYDDLSTFFKKSINWKKIKSHCKKFVSIHSDDDRWVSLHYGEIFAENLGAEEIVKHGMGHFNEDSGVTKLSIVLDSILKFSK